MIELFARTGTVLRRPALGPTAPVRLTAYTFGKVQVDVRTMALTLGRGTRMPA